MSTLDPLKSRYKKTEVPDLTSKAALLCIDLQYFDAAPGYGAFKDVDKDNLGDDVRYYFERLEETVIPNVQKLQQKFRECGMEIIHARIMSLTKDGRDRSEEHKRLGSHVVEGTKEADFLDEVKPTGDEIVISKTASGLFNATNIDYILRNLGIEQLVTVGVVTNECVETTVRDAADRGYVVFVPEDGVAAISQELHDAAIRAMNHTYAYIRETEDILRDLDAREEIKA